MRAVDARGQPLGPWSNFPTATAPGTGSATFTATATPTATATAAGTPTPTVATTQRGALIALYQATDGDNWKRNDNWLTDAPLDDWYGVTVRQFTDIVDKLNLWGNGLKGTLPDLSALAGLEVLTLGNNELRGPIPDLRALQELSVLILRHNELSGPFPDLSILTKLERVELSDNRLSGPVFDTHRLTELWQLRLENNRLSGPLPDVDAFIGLSTLNLSGNGFCLPAGASLSHADGDVDAHLKSLDLPACTEADYAAFPAAPANLTATVAGSRATLAWDAVADAAGYDLWVWDSLDRIWGPVNGAVNGTSYTQSVLTDGRNYYFQVRSRRGDGVHGPWSDPAHAIVVAQRFPPPASLGLNIFYQKYMKVGGVTVTAPTEVSDESMEKARAIVTGMYAGRPAYFEAVSDNVIRIILYKDNERREDVSQLPEQGYSPYNHGGLAFAYRKWDVAVARDGYRSHCYLLIHEFAHTIHSAIRDAPGGQAFDTRIRTLYKAALDAGLWQNSYAGFTALEYWAETVTF